MPNLYILDATAIVNLSKNAAVKAAIPCFATVQKFVHEAGVKAKSCGTCGRKKRAAAAATSQAYNAINNVMNCVNALPWSKKNELKRLLNTKKIRLNIPRGPGRVDKITF